MRVHPTGTPPQCQFLHLLTLLGNIAWTPGLFSAGEVLKSGSDLQQSWGWFTHTFELSPLWVVWILGRYEALSKEGSCLSPLWPGGTVRFESRPGQRPLFSFPFDEGKQECGQAGLHESHHLPLEVLHLYVVGMNLNEVTEEAVSLCILDAL